MNDINPYNCTIPGRPFVGYDNLRNDMLTGFCSGNSYAILGGRHCGKTSLLLQLEEDLRTQAKSFAPLYPLPRYLAIQEFEQLTPTLLFEAIYALVTEGSQASPWSGGEDGQEYHLFLNQLDKAQAFLDKQYGPDWAIVLLIDELDAALSKLPDDQFFYDLGDLLTKSRFRKHFRLITTGMNEMSSLVFYENSPLHNLRCEYLRVFDGNEIEELILVGFPDGIHHKAERRLRRLTGGHPYLLQGTLEVVWQENGKVDESALKRAKKKFLKEYTECFEHWLASFTLAEHIVYQRLLEGHEETLSIRDLHEDLEPSIADEIDGAITVLIYHGLIDDSNPEEPQIAGTMFRDWYQDNCPIPHIEQVFKGFHSLKTGIDQLAVDKQTKRRVQEALDVGIDELMKPDYEGQPHKEILASSLEAATSIFKKSGETAKAISTFIDKVRPLASLLGTGAGWLSVKP